MLKCKTLQLVFAFHCGSNLASSIMTEKLRLFYIKTKNKIHASFCDMAIHRLTYVYFTQC